MFTTLHTQTNKLTGVSTYTGAPANIGKNEGNSCREMRSWERGESAREKCLKNRKSA